MTHHVFTRFKLILYTLALLAAPLHAASQLKGLIEVPATLESTPEFAILFDGQQVYCSEDGFFSFPLEEQLTSLSILVCEDISIQFSRKEEGRTTQTIDGLRVDAQTPYYFARLTGRSDSSVFWKKYALNEGMVPSDCIVILANPDMVEKAQRLNIDASLGLVSGPKITFSADEKAVRLSSVRSLAKCTDLVRYFKHSKQKAEWTGSTKMTINA